MDFLNFFGVLDILNFLDFFWIFFVFFLFLSKLLRLLLNVTRVTTEHQKLSKQHKKLFFCQKGKKALAEGRSPPEELEVGPHRRSGPYLLV